jgi:predicted RNA-binding Zn ribbon-like protein
MVKFSFVGGHPALDFANTIAWTAQGPVHERLRDYGDVVAWGAAAGVLTAAEARRLRALANDEPLGAAEAYGYVVGLRAALHELFAAHARGKAPPPPALTAFNAALRDAAAQIGIAREKGRFDWRDGGPSSLSLVAHRVAWAAAQLMTSEQVARVGMCGGNDCGWVYLDTTKNHSRRWCTMEDCGSRAKARAYYARNKK